MIKKTVEKALKYGTLVSSFALIFSVLLQIYARFFMSNTPAWTEETSRIFFIYTVSFASGLALKDNYFVYLDVFYEKLQPIWQKWILTSIHILIFCLFGLMSYQAVLFVKLGIPETSASLSISMAYCFFSICIMSAGMAYYSFLEIIKSFK